MTLAGRGALVRAGRKRMPNPLCAAAGAFALAIAGAGLLAVPTRAAAAVYVAQVDAPRSFGHAIGDVMTERVRLEAAGHDVGNVAPPSSGRIDLWLERRSAREEVDGEGRRWLAIDYQIINAPRSVTIIALPALSLRTRGGDVLQVGSWPISVGPIVSDTGLAPAGNAAVSGAALAMQPDRGAAPIPLAPIARRIEYAFACLSLTLAAWLGWWLWRNRREAAQLPFARGWRQMRALHATHALAPADASWRILHRALNETAGQVVSRRSLPRLFSRAPWLVPMQPRIEQFYERSDARFFAVSTEGDGGPTAEAPSGAESDAALDALMRVLFRAERRRHR